MQSYSNQTKQETSTKADQIWMLSETDCNEANVAPLLTSNTKDHHLQINNMRLILGPCI